MLGLRICFLSSCTLSSLRFGISLRKKTLVEGCLWLVRDDCWFENTWVFNFAYFIHKISLRWRDIVAFWEVWTRFCESLETLTEKEVENSTCNDNQRSCILGGAETNYLVNWWAEDWANRLTDSDWGVKDATEEVCGVFKVTVRVGNSCRLHHLLHRHNHNGSEKEACHDESDTHDDQVLICVKWTDKCSWYSKENQVEDQSHPAFHPGWDQIRCQERSQCVEERLNTKHRPGCGLTKAIILKAQGKDWLELRKC